MKRKRQTPLALLWTRRDQLRFQDAVEKLVSLVNDLGGLLPGVKGGYRACGVNALARNAARNELEEAIEAIDAATLTPAERQMIKLHLGGVDSFLTQLKCKG